MSRILALFMVSVCSTLACGEPAPKSPQKGDEGVPANSLSETRLNDGKDPKKNEASSGDPTQPLMTPVGAAGSSSGGDDGKAESKDGKKDPKKGDPKKPDPTKPDTTKTGAVSKTECEAAVDHGLDLLLQSNPQFAEIPSDMIAQFKAQARSDKAGDNPCSGKGISRAEYNCSISATSSAEWQKCSKKK